MKKVRILCLRRKFVQPTICQISQLLVISRPPVAKRCPCQSGSEIQPCTCGEGLPPEGVQSRLGWDKVNNNNRRWKLFTYKDRQIVYSVGMFSFTGLITPQSASILLHGNSVKLGLALYIIYRNEGIAISGRDTQEDPKDALKNLPRTGFRETLLYGWIVMETPSEESTWNFTEKYVVFQMLVQGISEKYIPLNWLIQVIGYVWSLLIFPF